MIMWPVRGPVKGCLVCQRLGDLRFMQTLNADLPLHFVAIDVLGPFLANTQGFKYILSMADMHSRYVQTCLMKTLDIEHNTQVIPKVWVQIWGSPMIF